MNRNSDYQKVRTFFSTLNDAEFQYVKLTTGLVNNIQGAIKEYSFSKEYVCEKFEINIGVHDDFVKGNYDYSLKDMATLNALICEWKSIVIENNHMVKFADFKYQQPV